MSGAVPFLASLLVAVLLSTGVDVTAADQIIYPPLHNNEAVILEPNMLVGQQYVLAPDPSYSMNIAYDVPPQHHHHDEAYDGVVFRPQHEADLPPNRRPHHQSSTRVDEYGRPIPSSNAAEPAPASHSEPHEGEMRHRIHSDSEPGIDKELDTHHHSTVAAAQPMNEDEPFLHRALDKSAATTDVTDALDHDLGELNVRESGDDLTVHVGKNKVKTETVATITATITATDEHEDSYINIHRNAHEASAGAEHDHLDGRTMYLDGSKHDAVDQQGGAEIVPTETPAPDLSFLQDVEVLKVLFPWLEKHSGGQEPEPPARTTLDHVLPT